MSPERRRAERFMYPLPVRPAFPVHGLPASFTGFRWLAIWQRTDGVDAGEVSEVSLGHGHPDDGPWVLVTTTMKQAIRGMGDWLVGPVDLESASFHAVAGMVQCEFGSGYDTPSVEEERVLSQELARIGDTEGNVRFDGWEIEELRLDGVAHPALIRRLGQAWGLVIDQPDLVITASGTNEAYDAVDELVDVTTRLGDYAAGGDERADSIIRAR